MEVLYKSTRGDGSLISGSQAVLKGLADDGGLYVPNQIPKLDIELEKLAEMNYREIAYAVISRFLTDYDFKIVAASKEYTSEADEFIFTGNKEDFITSDKLKNLRK